MIEQMNSFSDKWTNLLFRFRWVVIVGFVVTVIIGGYVGDKLPNVLSGGGWDVEGSQSLMAKELVSEGFVGRGEANLTLIVHDDEYQVGSIEYSHKLEQLVNYLRQQEEIETVYSWLDAPEEVRENMVGDDEYTSMGFVGLSIDEGRAINILPDIQESFIEKAEEIGLNAYIVGVPAFWGDVAVFSQEGLLKAELLVLPLIFLVLLVIFRSLVSTVTALLVTIISIASSMGFIYFTGLNFSLSVFVTNAVIMLGLGVGIDYSLIMIHRFKLELLENGNNSKKAVIKTLKTAGHTVLFSGITIIATMSALFIVDLSAIRSIAFGAVLVVLMAVLTSLVLLPVILLLLGTKINALKIPFVPQPKNELNTKWYRWTHGIMKRPFLFMSLSVVILLFLAVPALDLKTFTPDERILPNESPVRQGITLIEDSFGVGATNPISVVIHAEEGTINTKENLEYIERLTSEITQLDHLTNVFSLFTVLNQASSDEIITLLSENIDSLSEQNQLVIQRFINESQTTAVIDIDASVYAASEESLEVVQTIDEELIAKANPPEGIETYIGGQTLEGHEANQVIESSLIPVLVTMLIIVYFILLITFRSVFLPLKAIAMNLLSVGATYGVLVFVIAYGNGASYLGSRQMAIFKISFLFYY